MEHIFKLPIKKQEKVNGTTQIWFDIQEVDLEDQAHLLVIEHDAYGDLAKNLDYFTDGAVYVLEHLVYPLQYASYFVPIRDKDLKFVDALKELGALDGDEFPKYIEDSRIWESIMVDFYISDAAHILKAILENDYVDAMDIVHAIASPETANLVHNGDEFVYAILTTDHHFADLTDVIDIEYLNNYCDGGMRRIYDRFECIRCGDSFPADDMSFDHPHSVCSACDKVMD